MITNKIEDGREAPLKPSNLKFECKKSASYDNASYVHTLYKFPESNMFRAPFPPPLLYNCMILL